MKKPYCRLSQRQCSWANITHTVASADTQAEESTGDPIDRGVKVGIGYNLVLKDQERFVGVLPDTVSARQHPQMAAMPPSDTIRKFVIISSVCSSLRGKA